MKVLYVDFETTGLDPKRHAPITCAMIVEVDGEEVERHHWRMNAEGREIDEGALAVHGISREQIAAFPDPAHVFRSEIRPMLDRHVDRFDKTDKFILAGHNVITFDKAFLQELFLIAGDNFFGSYFWHQCIDTLTLCHYLRYRGVLDLPNWKLETVAKHFDVAIQAHDAMSDLEATREVLKRIDSILRIMAEESE